MDDKTIATIIDVSRALRIQAMKAYLRVGMTSAKTEGTYNRQIWRAIRELYNGEIDEFAFIDELTGMIDNQLNRAWREGAKDVNIWPEDFIDDDYTRIEAIIRNEYEFVLRLADDILNARRDGGKLEPFRSRAKLWSNRFREVVNEARVHFGGKTRLIWHKGPSEHGCSTCSALDGLVAFAYEWSEAGFRPRQPPNPQLECEGWRCQCTLEPTEQRRSPRALNRLLNTAVGKRV